jgi:hypothetical protein
MPARRITPEALAKYPSEARALAGEHIGLLQRLPAAFLPILLLQIKQFDYSFPAERKKLKDILGALDSMSPKSFQNVMGPFAAIQPPPDIASQDWIDNPQQFTERLSAWLWSKHRIDDYHRAAENYIELLPLSESLPVTARFTYVGLGRDVNETTYPLFRKLAPHGTVFSNIDPTNGVDAVFAEAADRSRRYPLKYGHWYIEGGEPRAASELTTICYRELIPAVLRSSKLVHTMPDQARRAKPSTVESVTSFVESLTPEDLGIEDTRDPVLRHFEANVLTRGAGCQIFSTTFVQWAAREGLHRSEPLTLIARYGTRQVMQPMERLAGKNPLTQPQDSEGSLVDADMGAYYTWINQSRLDGSEQSGFLAWWEGGGTAIAISPAMARGSRSDQRVTMSQILKWMI